MGINHVTEFCNLSLLFIVFSGVSFYIIIYPILKVGLLSFSEGKRALFKSITLDNNNYVLIASFHALAGHRWLTNRLSVVTQFRKD